MQASSSKQKQPPREASPAPEDDYSSDYSSSSSDVTEDEDGTELTPALDAAILRTLSKIRKKEGVYGGEDVLQEELKRAQETAEKRGLKAGLVKKAAAKPYLLADYHRSKLLSGKTGADSDSEEEDDDRPAAPKRIPLTSANAYPTSSEPLTHVQQEKKLREEAVSAFAALAGDESDEDDEDEGEEDAGFVLKKRKADEKEVDEDEEEYRKFLLEMGGGEEEVRKVLGMGDAPAMRLAVMESSDEEDAGEGQKEMQAMSKVEREELERKKAEKKAKKAKEDDDFLMNYILNRGWIDRSDKHVPSYDEVVGPARADSSDEDDSGDEAAGKPKAGKSSHPWGELEEEDDFDEKAEQFETEYNFRFEEPGAAYITTHPRDIPSLVRRPDDARKSKRARRAERKAQEKAAQEEELRAAKGKKRREMEKRMAGLKRDLEKEGMKDLEWEKLEKVLDGEWDEGVWEKVVGEMLAKGAGRDEVEEEDDNEKPTWDDDLGDMEYDEEEDDGSFPYQPYEGEAEGMDVDDEGPINMDADFLELEPSPKKSKKSKKDKKGKGKAKDTGPEDDEDPADTGLSIPEKAAALKATVDSYNALAHEDIIAGSIPTRFKYTPSAPASFGLTPAEILLATDEELNKLVSVRSIAPYKKGGVGLQGKGLGKRVRELKETLKGRRWGEEGGSGSGEGGEQKREKDQGWKGKHGEKSEEGGEAKRSTKRVGKKERLKQQKAAEAAGGASAATVAEPEASAPKEKKEKKSKASEPSAEASAVPKEKKDKKRKAEDEVPESADVNAGGGEGGDKKKRRKKKKSKAEGEA
ncbi:hypothetical protein IAT38_006667 [Cryptococcus sp. DSM 104549]